MWNLCSRVHKLNYFPTDNVTCFIKRDDELGAGISGTKLRKYSSIIPHLKMNQIKRLIVIAGPQSNNLLAAVQIARELQLDITAFLIKPWRMPDKGNYWLSRLFISDDDIIWINRKEWPCVEMLALDYLAQCPVPGFILKEGASVQEALPGAMTLADDILRNQQELGIVFDHIIIDAGTGFSAAALIKQSAMLLTARVHVLLLADSEEVFRSNLSKWLDHIPDNFNCFIPKTARSFGAVNQTTRDEMQRMAREEGVLVDPIYSAKLFHESRTYILENKLQGNVLLIHSGGILTIPQFMGAS
jgi:1-aminocyclopropane-1-carboxylate deaminase